VLLCHRFAIALQALAELVLRNRQILARGLLCRDVLAVHAREVGVLRLGLEARAEFRVVDGLRRTAATAPPAPASENAWSFQAAWSGGEDTLPASSSVVSWTPVKTLRSWLIRYARPPSSALCTSRRRSVRPFTTASRPSSICSMAAGASADREAVDEHDDREEHGQDEHDVRARASEEAVERLPRTTKATGASPCSTGGRAHRCSRRRRGACGRAAGWRRHRAPASSRRAERREEEGLERVRALRRERGAVDALVAHERDVAADQRASPAA